VNVTDARLARLYDTDNPNGPDHEHYRRRTDQLAPKTVVDLGCGTGILTVTLADPGRAVTGIDPDDGMLAVARRRPGHELITWLLGDARDIEPSGVDLVLMTGNVAQHIGPSEWQRSLGDIAAGLRVGGVFTFETRNPAAEAWRRWQADTGRRERATSDGPLVQWWEVSDPDADGTVTLTEHSMFTDTEEHITVALPLTFRSVGQIEDDLGAVDLSLTNVWGGWGEEPFSDNSPLIIVEATRFQNGDRLT